MNREIRFRAWDTTSKGWLKESMIGLRCNGTLTYNDQLASNEDALGKLAEGIVLEQYTGLKDKNGKPIYEGDVFAIFGGDVERPSEYEYHGTVEFDADLVAFVVNCNGAWTYLHEHLDKQGVGKEIIGNIHESPNP